MTLRALQSFARLLAIMLPVGAVVAAPSLAMTDPVETAPPVGVAADAGAEILADEPAAEIIETIEDRYERMTVPVTIGGAGPFKFVVDTGAQATAVSQRVAQQLDLPSAGQATIVAMASRRAVEMVDMDGLGLASRIIDGIEAPVLLARNMGGDGIIGLDTLQSLRVLIDFPAQTITLVDADANIGRGGYEIVVRARRKLGQLIITDAKVDGVKTVLIIDTGAQSSIGNRALQKRLRNRAATPMTAIDVNGVLIEGDIGIARKVVLEDLALNDVAIAFADSPAFASLGLADTPALSLGMSHLAMFDRVAIDFAKRRIMFDVPRGAGWRQRIPGRF
ncbi:hypothetical protein HME9302_00282 [Alteripontixanthobacter maritimus]|uniref:Peptidase A2 domain-containing protein n=1 Tax=Alteripontixanthobacter maritimus TaxID=2161824 RepID=A0A369Q2H5_9SPHN|nr:retroviral-like aspartic protease family protein [Alteripontixanthobacter maritimus]RDC59103.1 hypothetical protein HME9302_00282 [Alteripontixanthobacter maritimus]